LKIKKAIVNVKNTDHECFKWAILSALYPPTDNPHRLAHYKAIEHDLDFSGINFPASLKDVAKFERQNHVSVHVYGSTITKKRPRRG
jgi:hypothetical protein